MKREVLIGSCWRRADPSGASVLFEVIATDAINSWGQRAVKGRTPSGKVIWCSLASMQNGDPRFEHVHDERVRRTG